MNTFSKVVYKFVWHSVSLKARQIDLRAGCRQLFRITVKTYKTHFLSCSGGKYRNICYNYPFAEICFTEINTALLVLFISIKHFQPATHKPQGEVREMKIMLWEIT